MIAESYDGVSDIAYATLDHLIMLSNPNHSYSCNETHRYQLGKDVMMVVNKVHIQGMRFQGNKFGFGENFEFGF